MVGYVIDYFLTGGLLFGLLEFVFKIGSSNSQSTFHGRLIVVSVLWPLVVLGFILGMIMGVVDIARRLRR